MGALATVKGFLEAWTRDVLLKPSESNPCGISSASKLDLLLVVAGPFAFADLSLVGALVLDDAIVWDHMLANNNSLKTFGGA